MKSQKTVWCYQKTHIEIIPKLCSFHICESFSEHFALHLRTAVSLKCVSPSESYLIISLEQILIFQITDPSSLRTALETQIIIVKASQFFSVFTNVSYCTNFAMLCLIRLWRCLFCHRADVSLRLSAFLLSASWMYAVTVKPIFFFHFYQKYVSGDQTEYLLKTEVVFDTMCECQSWFLNKF